MIDKELIERTFIGCLIRKPSLIWETKIDVKHFSSQTNSIVFRIIKESLSNNDKLDIALLTNALSKETDINYISLNSDYISLADTRNVKEYENIVIDNYLRLELFNSISEASSSILGDNAPQSIISALQSKIDNILNDKQVDDTSHVGNATREVMDSIYSASENKGLSGINTGIAKLNGITGGWQDTDLIVLGGRPGMGKTTLAMNYLLACAKDGKPCVIFSLEMSKQQLIMLLVGVLTGINTSHMRSGSLAVDEIREIEATMEFLNALPLFIVDSKRTVEEIVATTRFLKRKYGIRFMVLDYLQLCSSDKRFQNRNSELEHISRELKLLAGASDCCMPILYLSQLSRKLEDRANKRPIPSDLRESGAIEQDADMIQFTYRESYYTQDRSDNEVELIIPKHRMGDTGILKLKYENRSYAEI